ncbi:hypothetical protein MPSEU_000913800 [Mayamaea pseudoterrestris]|nr:hypothetical protein MPSEU_000913800 [Mayamaea pseudoterrestris]
MGNREPWVIRGSIVTVADQPFGSKAVPRETDIAIDLGAGISILLDHVLSVDKDGFIIRLIPARSLQQTEIDSFQTLDSFIQLENDEFLCPGMIDLHIHAPQYAYTGTATDRPLMGENGWLESYAFPAEQRLQGNPELARQVFDGVVQRTLRTGTTTAVYYGTLHLQPCQQFFDAAMHFGQRALVGKVCMDRNSPDNYCQTLEENISETEQFIQYIHAKAGKRVRSNDCPLPLVLPVVTPRFIPTCTPELLTWLGKMAAVYDCHVQTHLSESHDEVSYSRQLDATQDYKDGIGRTDAEILDSHQLLTEQCILAHAVHMTTADMDLLKRRGSAVAHCPLSNMFFAGGSLHCRMLMERGNKVGLGTDVAGGYSPSMLDSCRTAVIASRAIEHQCLAHGQTQELQAQQHVMDYRHAFYLATVGGAKALGLEGKIGNLQVGAEFDAMILSTNVQQSSVQVFDDDTLADIFQKLLVLGDDRHVKRVFVQGRDVTVD